MRRVFAALQPGGTFILQVTNRDWVKRGFQPFGWQWAGHCRILEERRLNLDDSKVHTDFTYIKPDGTHVTKTAVSRLYSWHELKRLLEEAGFAETTAWGAQDEPLTIYHNSIWATAKKL